MEDLQIAFDIKGFKEYFIKYKINEYKGKLAKGKKEKYYIFEKQRPIPETFGTFLLAFLNTDFSSKESCKDFIFEYLYVNLLIRINKNIHLNSDIHGDNTLPTDITNVSFDIILSEEEIDYYFNKIYDKFKEELLYYQKIYIAVANFKYFELLASEITSKKKNDKLKKKAILESAKSENYFLSLGNIASTTLFLKVNFNLRPFFTDKNKKFILENIPYSFSSKMFYDVLFITFKEFASFKSKIQIQSCENCGKYFIPQTAHDTKYCDSLFDGKRTCKQIGIEKTYLESLEQDKLLKLYRMRYQTLSKQSSTSGPNSKATKMYAYYKKEGPRVKQKYLDKTISSEEFKTWIDSTYLR
ncbi:MAG: DUF6076 domain-containing protein [Clostridia bacterium]